MGNSNLESNQEGISVAWIICRRAGQVTGHIFRQRPDTGLLRQAPAPRKTPAYPLGMVFEVAPAGVVGFTKRNEIVEYVRFAHGWRVAIAAAARDGY